MLDFYFLLFVLFGWRQGCDLFQGPKHVTETNSPREMNEGRHQEKTILCLDLDEILNKVPNIVLTCTSPSKFKFTLR